MRPARGDQPGAGVWGPGVLVRSVGDCSLQRRGNERIRDQEQI